MEGFNFELKFDDCLEQLVGRPEFPYNFYQMWLRSILVSWAGEIATSDLFDQGTGRDILPIWISYVIRKLRDSESPTSTVFVQKLQSDTKRLYEAYEKMGWKCLAKESDIADNAMVEGETQTQYSTDEELQLGEETTDDNFQLFTDQLDYLLNFIEQTFSTSFKYRLFVIAFATAIEKNPKELVMPYTLPFPSKYRIPNESDIFQIARLPSQTMIEAKEHFGSHSKTMFEIEDESIEDQAELQSTGKEVAHIMPLLEAQDINEEFWASYKTKDEM